MSNRVTISALQNNITNLEDSLRVEQSRTARKNEDLEFYKRRVETDRADYDRAMEAERAAAKRRVDTLNLQVQVQSALISQLRSDIEVISTAALTIATVVNKGAVTG